mmetsp:Transcript_25364/g.43334  ORF Transcript_25364/g.43334 Transcript_25364/m.43334 type:complete len:239 (+) Transcript_25364:73-789(+)
MLMPLRSCLSAAQYVSSFAALKQISHVVRHAHEESKTSRAVAPAGGGWRRRPGPARITPSRGRTSVGRGVDHWHGERLCTAPQSKRSHVCQVSDGASANASLVGNLRASPASTQSVISFSAGESRKARATVRHRETAPASVAEGSKGGRAAERSDPDARCSLLVPSAPFVRVPMAPEPGSTPSRANSRNTVRTRPWSALLPFVSPTLTKTSADSASMPAGAAESRSGSPLWRWLHEYE